MAIVDIAAMDQEFGKMVNEPAQWKSAKHAELREELEAAYQSVAEKRELIHKVDEVCVIASTLIQHVMEWAKDENVALRPEHIKTITVDFDGENEYNDEGGTYWCWYVSDVDIEIDDDVADLLSASGDDEDEDAEGLDMAMLCDVVKDCINDYPSEYLLSSDADDEDPVKVEFDISTIYKYMNTNEVSMNRVAEAYRYV